MKAYLGSHTWLITSGGSFKEFWFADGALKNHIYGNARYLHMQCG